MSRHGTTSWRWWAAGSPGPKGRIPRDPPTQRDSGNGVRALIIDTGYAGGEARDAAISRVREKLDLRSG